MRFIHYITFTNIFLPTGSLFLAILLVKQKIKLVWPNDYRENMATSTTLAKIYSTKYFCNAKVAGLGKIFVQQKFPAIWIWFSCVILCFGFWFCLFSLMIVQAWTSRGDEMLWPIVYVVCRGFVVVLIWFMPHSYYSVSSQILVSLVMWAASYLSVYDVYTCVCISSVEVWNTLICYNV